MKGRQKWQKERFPAEKCVANLRSATVVHLRRLVDSRAERTRTGLFYTEGMRFVTQAVQNKAHIETLVIAPELLTSPYGQKLAQSIRARGVPCLTVSGDVYRHLSLVAADEAQGIGAVVRQTWEPLANVRPNPKSELCWVALDAIRSPGNLGTIVRTSEAVGAAGLLLVGDAIDPYDPHVVRATMGALFAQRFVRCADLAELAGWKTRHNVCLVGASPHARDDYQTPYPHPVVLWLGSERTGLGNAEKAVCDRLVCIPQVGKGDSLNVSVAAGVLLYEVFNQKRKKPPP